MEAHCIYYASKYSKAILLKRITAEVFAEAMMEASSRTCLPEEILTDQGSFFVGCIVTNLCYLFDHGSCWRDGMPHSKPWGGRGGGGGYTINYRILNTFVAVITFPPFFCADTFDTSLLLIVCTFR